jgi:uncharacterized SAM-binding protein YcdF (DUF218 family)
MRLKNIWEHLSTGCRAGCNRKKEGIRVDKEFLNAAKIIWNYLKLDQSLKKSDCIIAMGSHDLRVADYAAELALGGWAPILVCSGSLGRLTERIWHESEAVKFAHVAMAAGVSKDRILLETISTNTGENILFSKDLLEEKGYSIRSAILVHKPYMERRVYATVRLLWPELDAVITSPQIPFEKYATETISIEEVIQIMVGDMHRVLTYPEKGYQIPQDVPDDVYDAFKQLVDHGSTQYLVEN